MKQSKAMTYLMRTVGRPVMKKYYERALIIAKKEVFDDIEKDFLDELDYNYGDEDDDEYLQIKKKHLASYLKKKKKRKTKC